MAGDPACCFQAAQIAKPAAESERDSDAAKREMPQGEIALEPDSPVNPL
jgi:hypothetical protein